MLPQPPFLARPVLTTMGANMAGEEYTPTLTEGGSPQASPQSEPPGPGMERGASPVLESPAFSPEDGFGPDALIAQPRSNPPAPPSAPPQPVPSPTPGVDPSPEEGDDWGPEWPGETPSKRLRSAGSASGSEAPAYGIPGNSPAGSLSPPLGGLSFQEQLWIRALKAEADRRWKEAEEVGIGPFPHPVNEPRPLLSHFYGIPENVADMWDSVSAAVNIPGHLLRALGNPSGLTGGAMGPPGIPRPSEVGDPTPPLAKATAAFPEEPFRKPLMVEASTQTTEGETAWNQWLAKARVGKGLAEHGLRTSDFELSKRIAECMPPLSAARESRLRDRRNRPDNMAVMLYIIHAESSYLSYRRAPRGYSDLLGGLEAKMLQPPANVWEKEVTQAWKILEASVVFRMAGVKKRADEKKARREGRASLRSATAKAAASGSARLPSSSASSSEEEACIFPLEIEAMNHVIGVQDGRMWRFLEDMVGYSLKDWRESSNTGLAADPEPASSEGLAAISVPPSPKSRGRSQWHRRWRRGWSLPTCSISRRFRAHRCSGPMEFKLLLLSRSAPGCQRHRGHRGRELRQHRACLQRQRLLQWHLLLQRQRAKPSERRVSSCRLLRRPLPRHLLLRFRRWVLLPQGRPTRALPRMPSRISKQWPREEGKRSGRVARSSERRAATWSDCFPF